jgi:hypothetical protein
MLAERESLAPSEDNPGPPPRLPKEIKKTKPSYQDSTEFQPTPKLIEEFKDWDTTGPKTAPGMVKRGNIDLTKRPVVHHPDTTYKGEKYPSVSTLYSGSYPLSEFTGNPKDKGEILVPYVTKDGKMLKNEEEAKAYTKKTGEYLGIFKTAKDADAYAEKLHLQQGAYQTWKNGGKYSPSVETYDEWTDPN